MVNQLHGVRMTVNYSGCSVVGRCFDMTGGIMLGEPLPDPRSAKIFESLS